MKGAPVQIVIDGEHYATRYAAFSVAKGRGFNGCLATFYSRIKSGASTWEEFLAPVSDKKRAGMPTRAAHRAEEKALMAQLCAELDARKAALKEVA